MTVPSDEEGGPPCPEACEPLFEAQDNVGDKAGDEVGKEAEDHNEDHDETNRSLNRSLGASRSANSSFIRAPALPSRNWSIWDGRLTAGMRFRWFD